MGQLWLSPAHQRELGHAAVPMNPGERPVGAGSETVEEADARAEEGGQYGQAEFIDQVGFDGGAGECTAVDIHIAVACHRAGFSDHRSDVARDGPHGGSAGRQGPTGGHEHGCDSEPPDSNRASVTALVVASATASGSTVGQATTTRSPSTVEPG